MAQVMTARQYAEFSGCDLAALEAAIAEAEADAITCESMDPSTLRKHNWTDDTEDRFRAFLRRGGIEE